VGELARGYAPARPLSSVQAYLDWLRFKLPPYDAGTREWPPEFLDEWRYIADALEEAKSIAAEGTPDVESGDVEEQD
jgi:hypothetical protein